MARRLPPRPLNITPMAMFAPADGCFYTQEDRRRAFAQQPFDGPDLPWDYLLPSNTNSLRPPMLRYGWRLGHEILMDIARQHFPDTIVTCEGHPLFGIYDEDEYSFPTESFTEENENYAATLEGPLFSTAVTKYLGISANAPRYIVVHHLYDSAGVPVLGLTVGTTYMSIIEDEQIEKLQALITPFAPNERPQWYLDNIYWRWRRVAPAREPTKEATGKTVAPAAQQPLTASS